MKIQNITLQNTTPQPSSFKARLVADEGALKLLERKWGKRFNAIDESTRERVFGQQEFNFPQIFYKLQDKFERITQKASGEVQLNLVKDRTDLLDPLLVVSYKSPDGKLYHKPNFLEPSIQLLDDTSHIRREPFQKAVEMIVATAETIMRKSGVENSENPFYEISNNLIKDQMKQLSNLK